MLKHMGAIKLSERPALSFLRRLFPAEISAFHRRTQEVMSGKIRVGDQQRPPGLCGSFTEELLVQLLGEPHADRVPVNKTGFRVVKESRCFFQSAPFL